MNQLNQFSEKQLDKTWDWQLLKKLMKYTKRWIPHLLLAVLLLFLSTASYLIKPQIIQEIVDKHLVTVVNTGSDAAMGEIYRLVLFLTGLVAMTFVTSYAQTYILSYVGQHVVYDIRSDLFAKMIALDLKFFEKNPVGRLVTRVTNDLNNIAQLYTSVLVTTLSDLAIVVGSLIMMFAMNAKLTLISMSVLPVLIISTAIFRRLVRKAYRNVRTKLAQINATLSENITGMKTIQVFNQEDKFSEGFEAINREYFDASKKEIYIYAVFRPFINLLYFVSLALAIIFGGMWVMDGSVEIGVVIAFTIYIKQFFRPILEFAEKFNILQSALTSIERVFLLFDEPERIVNDPKVESLPLKGSVKFDNVWFQYEDDKPVLKGVSFEAKPGETIAFVGHTGSGKSTIINLLMRLYDVQDGDIVIDGHSIKDYDKYDLRRRIIPVLQDVFLFSGDIRSNIRLLSKEYSDEQVLEALKFVNADKFVSKYSDGINHAVTEGGSTLSQGERQLLSFARAILRNPDILILDEATASIDTETEQYIQEAIQKVSKKRTTFIVAHRLSTIKDADRIIVLHRGEIREMGTHDELIAKGGLYYDLYQLDKIKE